MGCVLYHVKPFWMVRVRGLHFSPHLRSPWLTGELTRPANVRLENESQSGPQVDRHTIYEVSATRNACASAVLPLSAFRHPKVLPQKSQKLTKTIPGN